STNLPRRPLVEGLKLLPLFVGLISTSILFGYANSDGQPQQTHAVASPASMQVARGGNGTGSRATVEAAADDEQAQDPLNNYKATLDVLKKNYYGAPLDTKKTRQLTYEAI